MRITLTAITFLLAIVIGGLAEAQAESPATKPLKVMLIPADGGTADGTRADFTPLFKALEKSTGYAFDLQVGQSYAAVIEGMCAGHADIAWFGPVSYQIARDRGCAKLLAVETRNGSATYFSGLFVRADSDIQIPAELKGRSIALGSMHSTSSFAYPLAMASDAGVAPLEDFSAIRLTGSHVNALLALNAGRVDAAGASFISFERAVNQGGLQASKFRVIAKSDPIPNPPLAMSPKLPANVQTTLREALASLHLRSDIDPESIRGYGGKRVDRYDVAITDAEFDRAAKAIAFVDETYKEAVLELASDN